MEMIGAMERRKPGDLGFWDHRCGWDQGFAWIMCTVKAIEQREADARREADFWVSSLHPRSRKRVKPMWTEKPRLVLQGTACKPLGC